MVKRGFSFFVKSLPDLQQVGEAARKFALSLGFSINHAEEISLSIIEIGQYNLRTAPRILIQGGSVNRGRTLKILIDNEHGIGSSLRQSLHDETLPLLLPQLGISSTPRFMDFFKISAPTVQGATFILKKHLPLAKNIFNAHAITLAHHNQVTNGDDFLIKEYEGDKVLIALIDGEGQGAKAAVLSALVKDYLSNHVDLPLLQLIEECHYLLRNRAIVGGVVMSLLRLTPGKIFYVGIGDTHAYLQQSHFRKLTHYNGKVGDYDLPIMEVTTLTTQQSSRLVLCTDGIKEHIKAESLAADLSPQQVAEKIMESHRRINGDASVITLDYQSFGRP